MQQDMVLEVRRAQRGDREAFIRLFRKLEPELYGLAKSIVRRDEDCADAFQETTLKAYKSLSTLRQPKYFKTWVIRILINECNQLLRMRSRTVVMAELPEPAGEARFTGEYEENRKQDLREAVENLDETLRIVIHLFYYQDLPIKEVAGVLEISEGAVRARLHRARGILADKVKQMGKEELAYGNA
ncbi:sigma-70 family RNA polymerase sigma factor [Paenibacillus sp. TH7-28]